MTLRIIRCWNRQREVGGGYAHGGSAAERAASRREGRVPDHLTMGAELPSQDHLLDRLW
jgi:hypothetical protein